MLIGDMAIKNLAPKDANSSGRIIKNMRICGSGLYEYGKSEASLMGLDPEQCPGDTFKVFRPAEVLVKNKDLYARVPIITGHHVRVNTGNAKELAVGMVGDTVQAEVGEDGETYLYTTGTIITGDGIDAYERLGQLSVGYDPIVKWEAGEHNGEHYDAVLTGFNEINHLLICGTARGGPQCMIMDEAPWGVKILNGGKEMNIFKKIFGAPKMTGDAAVVSAMLQSIKAGADITTQVSAVKTMMGDAVDATLGDYFDELLSPSAKTAEKATLDKAIDIVDSYCQKIMGDEKKPEEPEKKEEKKPEEPEKKEEKKPEEPEKKEETGDKAPACGDSIDYDKLAAAIVEKMKAKPEQQTGDELKEFENPLTGDSADKGLSSDDVLKSIF